MRAAARALLPAPLLACERENATATGPQAVRWILTSSCRPAAHAAPSVDAPRRSLYRALPCPHLAHCRREKLPTLAAELRWPFISPARLVQFERERAELLREFPQLVDFTREAYRYQALASHPGVTPDDVKALTSPRT